MVHFLHHQKMWQGQNFIRTIKLYFIKLYVQYTEPIYPLCWLSAQLKRVMSPWLIFFSQLENESVSVTRSCARRISIFVQTSKLTSGVSFWGCVAGCFPKRCLQNDCQSLSWVLRIDWVLKWYSPVKRWSRRRNIEEKDISKASYVLREAPERKLSESWINLEKFDIKVRILEDPVTEMSYPRDKLAESRVVWKLVLRAVGLRPGNSSELKIHGTAFHQNTYKV